MPTPASLGALALGSAVASVALALPAAAQDLTVGSAALGAAPIAVSAPAKGPSCSNGRCDFRVTPDQLLVMIERLVSTKQYDEARPLVAALGKAPGMEIPYGFLEGLIALETGDAKSAITHFRAVLAKDPQQTRVRLELARALMAAGDAQGADYHLRLVQDADDLPEDLARSIRQVRSVIRTKKNWRLGFDIGLAPDTNINSATSAETVDVNFGPQALELELDEGARARSGTGITANIYGSVRLPTSERMAIVTDVDASMVNYSGETFDDYTFQLATGPELRLGENSTVSLQAVGLYRRFGGQTAARQYGAKLGYQWDPSRTQRVGLQLDGRRAESDFGPGYSGWQLSAVSTYEQVVAKSAVATLSLYARRDAMDLATHASKTVGASVGIGGELPLGINAGVSGGVSYAVYDAPQFIFSPDERKDWRYQGRVYLGFRNIRYWGFSPSVEYRYSKVDTNYDFYKSDRHRFEFKLARYF
jgi:outer membrane protein